MSDTTMLALVPATNTTNCGLGKRHAGILRAETRGGGSAVPRREETVRAAVIARVLAGEYQAGQRLPGRRDLAVEFGACQSTVRAALEPLVRSGTLYVLHGRGTFVARHGAPVPVSGVDAAKDVAQEIRKRLSDGFYPACTRLPDQGSLAAEFGVSLHTIRAARQALIDTGILTVIDGGGTFVVDPGAPRPRSYRSSGPGGRQTTWAAPFDGSTHVQRVRSTVIARINDHTYSPGTRITTVALAAQMGVSTATAGRALAPLLAQGRLRSRRGRGQGYVVTEAGPASPRPAAFTVPPSTSDTASTPPDPGSPLTGPP